MSKDPGELLRERLAEIQIPESWVDGLTELAYTASERGLIPFSLDDECARQLFALTLLSANLDGSIPDELRM